MNSVYFSDLSLWAIEYLNIEIREAEGTVIVIVRIIIAHGTYMVYSMLSTSHMLTHFIFRTTPCGRYCVFCLHLTWKEFEVQIVEITWPRFTELSREVGR